MSKPVTWKKKGIDSVVQLSDSPRGRPDGVVV
jgi:hypothetical protein